jgi:hypothetical protein
MSTQEQSGHPGRSLSGGPASGRGHKRKSFLVYGWYAVLGIVVVIVGAALGLAV